MSKTITAIYEHGLLRPTEPLDLEEGTEVAVEVPDRAALSPPVRPADVLSEIAALPAECPGDPQTARRHDEYLYRAKSAS